MCIVIAHFVCKCNISIIKVDKIKEISNGKSCQNVEIRAFKADP